ncbi:MAG: Kup system potassium uptake protein [Myxococcaceae bacterium]|jgi:KUP system potassium uptake protein|nr:Kup system potassium uptake protein [Myxococcaceae bacterium]MEA2748456.1 system potassium uptake protein [Myxococcales bacterium]
MTSGNSEETRSGPRSLRKARAAATSEHAGHGHPTGSFRALVLGAVGIVFGDIGTSPLYAFKECITGEHPMPATAGNVLGVLSLIVWSLTLVVTVKYLVFVMRADNDGEGGILALLALTPERMRGRGRSIGFVALLVIAGAALLYGDGMITPAISVLSAVEGLGAEATALKQFVVPITCVLLLALFAIQSRGTDMIGTFFGPIMVLWFVTIGALGAYHLTRNVHVIAALNPFHAYEFFAHHKLRGITVLGGVVLTITGGEALYADMGHFGRKPIRIAWLALVFPSLLLAYFGMGAIVLLDPSAASNPFYAMVPRGPATYALVALATAATIIASQALISGAFSLTNQAVQLGFFPRVTIKHTSGTAEGQIYVPEINWMLAIACLALVVWAQESSKLAAAYGIAVTGTMAITSIVFFVVTHQTWKWPLWKALPLLLFFLSFDIPFLVANATKFMSGGYVPVIIGATFFTIMVVWRRGRRMLSDALAERTKPVDEFLAEYGVGRPPTNRVSGREHLQYRIHGTGVVMSSIASGVPPVVVHHVERLRVLHEKLILLTIVTARIPFVSPGKRTQIEDLGGGLSRVVGNYGFMETPDVPALLKEAKGAGLDADIHDVTYFLGRETMLAGPGGQMGEIEETLFAFLTRNSRPATAHFKLPPNQVIEIGTQIDL